MIKSNSETIDLGQRSVSATVVIFLHIPKAGGTTIGGILNQQYPKQTIAHFNGINSRDQLANLPTQERSQIRLIRGHMAFGLHQFLSCPATYFTLLRDPVDRVVSEYYYISRSPNVPGYSRVQSMSLEDYVVDVGKKVGNLQTRLIFGLSDVACSGGDDILEVAKRNLDQQFAVVGLMERFDETLVLLKQAFGWKSPVYVQQNVTASRKKKLSDRDLDAVKKYNSLDIALYQHAQRRFEKQISELGDDFEPELKALQTWNRFYQPFGKTYGLARRWVLQDLLHRV